MHKCAVSGWLLPAACCLLAAGGWRLAAGGWRLGIMLPEAIAGRPKRHPRGFQKQNGPPEYQAARDEAMTAPG